MFAPSSRKGTKKYRASFIIEHSDCHIITDKKEAIETAKRVLVEQLSILKEFIARYPAWKESLVPIEIENAPEVAVRMQQAVSNCNVGPMAAVAGVLADMMAEKMQEEHDCKIAVVENGGEIAVHSDQEILIGLDVLTTALKSNIGFKVKGAECPMGIGTSSGQFGHAFSFGEADAVTIFAENAGLADAAATRICNEVIGDNYEEAVKRALPLIDDIPGVFGVLIVRGDFVGTYGITPELIRIKSLNENS